MINLALILTSPDINFGQAQEDTTSTSEVSATNETDEPGKKADPELLTYIQAAVRDTGKLNGNERVAEQTGIPLERCNKFKEWLIEQGMIKKGQGATVANYPKDVLIRQLGGV
jgi:hypothetical protein